MSSSNVSSTQATATATRGISEVELVGIHGHQSISQSLSPGLNILHGKNGSGKTTFLHAIANLLERDLARFCYVTFEQMHFTTFEGFRVSLRQLRPANSLEASNSSIEVSLDGKPIETIGPNSEASPALDRILREKLGNRSVYLPAFRSILEGTHDRSPYFSSRYNSMSEEEREKYMAIVERERVELNLPRGPRRPNDLLDQIATKTLLCRQWFGEFVPTIRYPSLVNVRRAIIEEIEQALFEIGRTDQQILSSVFVQVLEAVLNEQKPNTSNQVGPMLEYVRESLAKLQPGPEESYSALSHLINAKTPQIDPASANVAGVLKVYGDALKQRTETQERAFSHIRKFVDSVNRFLDGKALTVDTSGNFNTRRAVPVSISVQNQPSASLAILSSGERHVLTLIFSATHMKSTDGIVLLDEPELSLHIDWQRIILSELMKQLGDRQIIACTHAPEVAADHFSHQREFNATPWCAGTTITPSDEDTIDETDE